MSGGPEDSARIEREASGVRRFPDPNALLDNTASLLTGAALVDRNKHLVDIARGLLAAAAASAKTAAVGAASVAGGPLAGVAADLVTDAAIEAIRRAARP